MDKLEIIEKIKEFEAQLDIDQPVLSQADETLMKQMVQEINAAVGEHFRGYSDIVDRYVAGAGEIVEKYIFQFESHMTRASLLHHLVGNRTYAIKSVNNAAEIVWQLYTDCRTSAEFAEWGIQQYYDDAFVRLRAKVLADRLIESIRNPLEFSALPRTVKMLASWRKPQLEGILLNVLQKPEEMENYLHSLEIQRRFGFDQMQIEKECRRWKSTAVLKAVVGIAYYPSQRAVELLCLYEANKRTEMQEKLLMSKTRTEKYDVKYDYEHILKVISNSIDQIDKAIRIKHEEEKE